MRTKLEPQSYTYVIEGVDRNNTPWNVLGIVTTAGPGNFADATQLAFADALTQLTRGNAAAGCHGPFTIHTMTVSLNIQEPTT